MTLKLININKEYNSQKVIDNLSISFDDKGMIGIVGRSGSGKSTLLNIIAGNLKVDNGQVLYNNRNINSLDNYHNIVSYLHQNSNLIESMKIKDNILLFVKIKQGIYDNHKYNQYIKSLGIEDLLDKYPNQLSGGQKQRVSLVRSLLCDCPIILCDEPTGALDDKNSKIVMEELRKYSRKHLVLLVSHEKTLIQDYCTNIIDMNCPSNHINNSNNTYEVFSNTNQNKHQRINYVINRLLSDKYKISLILIGQIVTVLVSIVLIAGINGFNSYYQELYNSSLIKNDFIIQSLSSSSINTQDALKINKYVKNKQDFYDLTEGNITSNKRFVANQIVNPKLSKNEVVVNNSFKKKYLNDRKQFDYYCNKNKYKLKVNKVIDDIISEPCIYFDVNKLDINIQTTIKDNSKIIVTSSNINKFIKQYDQKYILFNEPKEIRDSYKEMYNLCLVVCLLFLAISIIISFVLYYLVYYSIILERKKDYAIFMTSGYRKSSLKRSILIETIIISFIISIISSLISLFFIYLLNSINIVYKVIGSQIDLKLPIIFNSKYDVFVYLFFVYLVISYLVYLRTTKHLLNVDFVSVLKEE